MAGKPGAKYTKHPRRIEILDEERGEKIAFITNDFDREPQEIADLYKRLAAMVRNYTFNLCQINNLVKLPGKTNRTKNQNQMILNFPGQ